MKKLILFFTLTIISFSRMGLAGVDGTPIGKETETTENIKRTLLINADTSFEVIIINMAFELNNLLYTSVPYKNEFNPASISKKIADPFLFAKTFLKKLTSNDSKNVSLHCNDFVHYFYKSIGINFIRSNKIHSTESISKLSSNEIDDNFIIKESLEQNEDIPAGTIINARWLNNKKKTVGHVLIFLGKIITYIIDTKTNSTTKTETCYALDVSTDSIANIEKSKGLAIRSSNQCNTDGNFAWNGHKIETFIIPSEENFEKIPMDLKKYFFPRTPIEVLAQLNPKKLNPVYPQPQKPCFGDAVACK